MRTALIIIILSASLLPISCRSKFNRLEYLSDYENLVIYRLKADDYPSDKNQKNELTAIKEFPALGPEQIIDILGNFEYIRDTHWGRVQRRVFYKEELDYMAPYLARHLKYLGDKYRLVIVSRYDPDKSVLSRMERVSSVIWLDEEGLNVVFGEIRTEIPHNEYLVDDDEWKNIFPVSLNRAYHDLSLVKNDFFEKKVIGGRVHETWAQIPEEKLQTLRYIPLEKEKLEKSEKAEPEDISKKLKSLQKAKDDGLITGEEFEAKRKQLLESY